MTKKAWIKTIKQAAIDAGTYKEYFDSVIDTLADILEKRDWASEDLNRIGEELVSGTRRNPTVVIWNDLNKSALAYWRELGLTPAGLRKINDDTFAQKEKKISLGELLKLSKEEQ